MVTIFWNGTHTQDWPAWAAFHREVGAHEASCGHAALAAKHEEIAHKFDRRATRAAKKAAKAVAS
jgi:hypothetical protein